MKTLSKVSLFVSTLFLSIAAQSQCDSQSVRTPSNASSSSFSGSSFQFVNPMNILPSSNSFASVTALLTLLSGKSEWLMAKGFAFNLPTNAIVCGIEARIQESADGINILSVVLDDKVQLLSAGVPVGSNLAKPDWWGVSPATKNYGGSGNLWGRTWTAQQINAADFGVGISVQMSGLLSLLPTAKIHSVQLVVNYSLASLLPVKIVSVDIRPLSAAAQLNWQLADLDAQSKMTIERSADAIAWNTVFVQESVLPEQHAVSSFTDQSPLVGQSYYRLKIINSSGVATYSKTLSFSNNQGNSNINIFPNPASSQLTVTGAAIGQVTIYNTYGQRVINKVAGNGNSLQLDIEQLPAGVYVLKSGQRSVKFIRR